MNAGWEAKCLGEVIVASGTVDPTKVPDQPFRYVDVSSVCNERFEIQGAQELLGRDAPSRARRRIKTGDVIFATIRPTLKRIAIVPPSLYDQVCSTGFFVFRTKPFLEPRFLFYFLRSDDFLGAMERLQTGASYPAVNDSQVRQQEIRFPPLAEQRRIVAILDEAFAGLEAMRANAEKNLQNARDLFDGERNATFAEAPRWQKKTLGEVIATSGTIDPTKAPNTEFCYVDVSSVSNENFEIQEFQKLLGCDAPSRARRRIRTGDVLFATIRPTLRRVAVVPSHLNDQVCSTGYFVFRTKPFLDNRFLFHFLLTDEFMGSMERLQTGASYPAVNDSQVRQQEIRFPSLDEQRIIVARLDSLREKTARLQGIYREKLAAIEELKQAFLQKAFSGELTSSESIAA